MACHQQNRVVYSLWVDIITRWEKGRSLRQPTWAPFWVGCIAGPIAFMILLERLGVLHDSFSFWFFALIAIVVFGLVGGMAFQVIHDLNSMRRFKLLRAWDYMVLIAISVAMFVAGVGLYSETNSDINPFNNKTFAIAGAFAASSILIYGLCRRFAPLNSQETRCSEPVGDSVAPQIRAFVAGGLALMFVQGLVPRLGEFFASAFAGKPAWLTLFGVIASGSVGFALGWALFTGNSRAVRWVRLLLFLSVAGGGLVFIMASLQIVPYQSSKVMADLIASLVLLVLLHWKSPQSGHAAHDG